MTIQARVAKRYSKAFVGAAQEAGTLKEEFESLRTFCEIKKSSLELDRFLLNITVKARQKADVIKEICAQYKASELLGKFLVLLALKGRLDCLDEIEIAVMESVDLIQNVKNVSITTGVALSPKSRGILSQGLSAKLGAQIRLDETLDPSIWGGAVVQIGSTVYDGSLKGKLNRLRDELVKEN